MGSKRHIWTEDEIEFLKEVYRHYSNPEISEMIYKKFGWKPNSRNLLNVKDIALNTGDIEFLYDLLSYWISIKNKDKNLKTGFELIDNITDKGITQLVNKLASILFIEYLKE